MSDKNTPKRMVSNSCHMNQHDRCTLKDCDCDCHFDWKSFSVTAVAAENRSVGEYIASLERERDALREQYECRQNRFNELAAELDFAKNTQEHNTYLSDKFRHEAAEYRASLETQIATLKNDLASAQDDLRTARRALAAERKLAAQARELLSDSAKPFDAGCGLLLQIPEGWV